MTAAQATFGRVVVADDDVLVREGVASVLTEAGYEVVAKAGDGNELVTAVRQAAPELIVVDIRMPPTQTSEGIDVAREIRTEFPTIGILLLSAHVELETAIDLLKSGQRIGYLLKSRVMHAADLVDALQRIAVGGCVIDPALVHELVTKQRQVDPLAVLTPREREVLALVAEGRSNSGRRFHGALLRGASRKIARGVERRCESDDASSITWLLESENRLHRG